MTRGKPGKTRKAVHAIWYKMARDHVAMKYGEYVWEDGTVHRHKDGTPVVSFSELKRRYGYNCNGGGNYIFNTKVWKDAVAAEMNRREQLFLMRTANMEDGTRLLGLRDLELEMIAEIMMRWKRDPDSFTTRAILSYLPTVDKLRKELEEIQDRNPPDDSATPRHVTVRQEIAQQVMIMGEGEKAQLLENLEQAGADRQQRIRALVAATQEEDDEHTDTALAAELADGNGGAG